MAPINKGMFGEKKEQHLKIGMNLLWGLWCCVTASGTENTAQGGICQKQSHVPQLPQQC